MSGVKMHDGEADIDEALVRRLLAAQLPRWADLPLDYMESAAPATSTRRYPTTGRCSRTPGAGFSRVQLGEHELVLA